MSERLDDAPPRTWQSILSDVPAATPTGGLSAAPEPAPANVAAYARTLKRTDETPADVLAALEYEVSEQPTREAIDTMRAWRATQRTEMERLDALEPPDDDSWLVQRIDGFWTGIPALGLGMSLIPMAAGSTFDVPVAIGAAGSLLAAGRVGAVEAGWTKKQPEWRGLLLVIASVILTAPIITIVRVVIAGGSLERGPVTTIAIATQLLAGLFAMFLALRAPRAADHRERRMFDAGAPLDPDDAFYAVIEERIDTLYAAVKAQAPGHLRAALADRDPAVARSSRHTVVEAIRVLFEREEIDADEATWMLREAVGG